MNLNLRLVISAWVLILSLSSPAFADNLVSPGTHEESLTHQGLQRKYIVHIPASYDGARPFPLVLNFHGGGGNAKAQMAFSEMNDKSEQSGFIVVYPEAMQDLKMWNVGPRDPKGVKKEVPYDDVGFVRDLLAVLEQKYSIDKKRIYATGHSNGGFMVYRLACEMADVFAAAAPVSASVFIESCEAARPISILHIHGTEDLFIPFQGGPSSKRLPKILRNSENQPSAQKLTEIWQNRNQCGSEAVDFFKNADTTCRRYTGCKEDSEVALCVVDGGGHTWPGAVKFKTKKQGLLARWTRKWLGKTSEATSANDLIWDFFSRHNQ